MFTHAVTRKPGPDFAQGITTAGLGAPEYASMIQLHTEYIKVFQNLGVNVEVLDPIPGYPDAYFVEDVAVVTPEIAVVTRPGAASRLGEEHSIQAALAQYRQLAHIEAPGTVEGGDVLMAETHFFIGLSERTNPEGARQLGDILSQYAYTWTPIPVAKGLHLKSSVTYVGANTLLVTKGYANLPEFNSYQKIVVDSAEDYAANTLLVNNHLITPSGFPSTRRKLEKLGLPVIEIDATQARKMDGGLSCMSLRF